MAKYRYIGVDSPRMKGREMLTGRARYTQDLNIPGMLYAKVLRSPYAHAEIVHIDTTKAEALSGVVCVLTYKNCPPFKVGDPVPHKPVLDKKAYCVGDGVALVAAETEAIAEEALDLIEVKYKVLKPVLSIDEAVAPDAPTIYPEIPGNVIDTEPFGQRGQTFTSSHFGDVEKGFAEAEHIEEGDCYILSGQNALPPESPSVICEWDGDDLIIRGSNSAPGAVKIATAPAMGMPMGKMRLITPFVGGSYGSKVISICSSIIFYAAALAKVARRPVALFYTKEEHFATYLTRLTSKAHYKIGLKKDGTVTAVQGFWQAECGIVSGEQACMIGVGLIGQVIAAKCENVDIQSRIVMTNKIATGPYRGFGYLENTTHITNILYRGLQKIDLDPVEYYRRNRLKVGDTIYHAYCCTGFEKAAGPDIIDALNKGAAAFNWESRWKGWGKPTKIDGPIVRAIGVGLAGENDVGEQASNGIVQLNYDGSVLVYTGAVEFGAGTRDVMQRIAAEVMNMPLDLVKVSPSDTMSTPVEWGSTGSRSTYSMGNAILLAARDAKRQLMERAAAFLHCPAEILDTEDGFIYFKPEPQKRIPWIPIIGVNRSIEGVGYFPGGYSITVQQFQFIEVELDTETGKVSVIDQVCATDCGQIINPRALKGQLDGYFPGIDMTTREETIWDNKGRIVNGNMIDYKTRPFNEIPPHHQNVVAENPPQAEPEPPFGAFGAGEPSIAPGISAITMALYNATGVWFNDYPITPAKILKALADKKEEK